MSFEADALKPGQVLLELIQLINWKDNRGSLFYKPGRNYKEYSPWQRFKRFFYLYSRFTQIDAETHFIYIRNPIDSVK